MSQCVIAALYKFVSLPDYVDWQGPLKKVCREQGIMGTLLLASEGINGTIAGSREGIDAVLAFLKKDPRFSDLEHKESYASALPFHRLKVRLKKEIVTLGVAGIDPNRRVGTYVEAEAWNALISDPEVILIDTRNTYEYDIGTFRGSVNPRTTSFREFPRFVKENLDPRKHKKVAMHCTGGIRCEKASSYMLSEGFETVYHLKGGILKYLETIPPEESLWEGECFVFDNRASVNHALEAGRYDLCHGCRHPITAEDKTSEHYEEGVCCPHCVGSVDAVHLARVRERQKQMLLSKQRGGCHIGAQAQTTLSGKP